jgi:predicted PurR-regulated permease PerM
MAEIHNDESVWQRASLFLLTLSVLVLCGLILFPFFSALVGAIILAVVTQRPYRWLSAKVKSPSTRAAIGVMLIVLSVIVPGFFLAQDLGEQAFTAVNALRDDANQQKFIVFVQSHPAVASRIQTFTDSLDIATITRTTAAYLGTHLAGVLGSTFRVVTQLVVMLFILFFLFRDHELAIRFFRSLLPLREEESTVLVDRLHDTIYATALGRLAIALIQGTLAGLAFWILGVPGPVLWAFTTAVLAMIPAFGAVLVWAPLAIFLGTTGHWGKAAILAVWGGVIVSTIDNILYPILVGTRLRAHTVTILISILGGIALFGITGIILGPVIFGVADTLLDFWRVRNAQSTVTTEPTASS